MFAHNRPGKLLAEIVLFCKAMPLARPRVGKTSHVYQPLENQFEMRKQLRPYKMHDPIDKPFWLEVHAFYESPGFRDISRLPCQNFDLDNVVKAVADNLTFSAIITDDKWLEGITASKQYSVEDYVLIRLNEVINAA